MDLSNFESETHINYNEQDKNAEIFTHNRALIRKLDAFCQSHPTHCKLKSDEEYEKWGCKTYSLLKKQIKIRFPQAPRVLSTEQKLQLVDTLNKGKERSAFKENKNTAVDL
jgi:hypothetical protein